MFVRFKRRERVSVRTTPRDKAGTRGTGKFVLSAVLVRSQRRGGKPRQQVVAYLGSIPEADLAKVPQRQDFWEMVDARLDSLGLDPGQRQKVEASLASVVPRPTPQEIAQDRRRRDAELDTLRPGLAAVRRALRRWSRRKRRPST